LEWRFDGPLASATLLKNDPGDFEDLVDLQARRATKATWKTSDKALRGAHKQLRRAAKRPKKNDTDLTDPTDHHFAHGEMDDRFNP